MTLRRSIFVSLALPIALAAGPATTQTTTRPATQPAVRLPPKPAPVALPKQPELWQQIAQRHDHALRESSISKALSMLSSDDAGAQLQALQALTRVAMIKFDRKPFVGPIRRAMSSPNADVRSTALNAIGALGTQEDLTAIGAMAADASPKVRANVAQALVNVNGRVGSPELDAAVLTLLNDPDRGVRREMMRPLWNIDLSEAVEARLIVLSRDKDDANDAIDLALTTRPYLRAPVVARLLEVIDDPGHTYRVSVGLKSSMDASAVPAVQEALLQLLDESLDSNIRDNCIVALGKIPSDAVRTALQTIADDADEEDRIRATATRVLNGG